MSKVETLRNNFFEKIKNLIRYLSIVRVVVKKLLPLKLSLANLYLAIPSSKQGNKLCNAHAHNVFYHQNVVNFLPQSCDLVHLLSYYKMKICKTGFYF